jgi:hypothetical protein
MSTMDYTLFAHLGVVNMLLRPIAAKSVTGNLKLLGAVSKAQEAEDPKQNTNGLSRDHFDCSNLYVYMSSQFLSGEGIAG